MTYARPQVLASYSLDSAIGDVMASCSSAGVPSGDIFVDLPGDCGYVSSPVINGHSFMGNWNPLS